MNQWAITLQKLFGFLEQGKLKHQCNTILKSLQKAEEVLLGHRVEVPQEKIEVPQENLEPKFGAHLETQGRSACC